MKRCTVAILFLMFAGLFSAVASQAAVINFNEVSTGTTDPTINGVSFWAGDGASFFDTFVADDITTGNNYLWNGLNDGTKAPDGLFDTFIGVNLSSGNFSSVTFDLARATTIPGGTSFGVAAYAGGSQVALTTIGIGDYDYGYHAMSLSYGGGFDTLYIFGVMDSFGIGESFRIDNFNYQGGGQVPEPGTMLLFASGLLGTWYMKRKMC